MNRVYADFLQLIKSAIQNIPIPSLDLSNFDAWVHIAKKHRITTMLYYGLVHSGRFSPTDPKIKPLFQAACADLVVHERQMHDLNRITQAFDANGIDHMIVKGPNIKAIYPKPEMRPMCDIDILIRTEQYEAIRPVMTDLGYEEKLESNHEFVWQNAKGHIELHKFLIPSYNPDYFSYYGNGWRLARKAEGSRYVLSDEDAFIYLFTHFAKHYRDSGIGLRHVIDLWVCHGHKQLNETYMLDELKKLQLDEFYANIMAMLRTWFDGEPATPVTEFITDFIFHNGVYGTRHSQILSKALREKKTNKTAKGLRVKRVWRMVFLPFDALRQRYPVLERWPILLPFVWFWHLLRRLFSVRKMQRYGKEMAIINEKNISEYENALHYVGLDFNFEE